MQIVIRCPETGKNVPTGMASDAHSFETLSIENCQVQCRACGEAHRFSKADASLSDEVN